MDDGKISQIALTEEEEKFCPKKKKKRELEKDIFGGDLVNNMAAVTTPSGFRFVPTDLELVRDYLLKKITNQPLPSDAVVIEYDDVYSKEPWNLPVNNIGNCGRFFRRCIRKRNYYFVHREKNDDKSLCDGNGVKHMVKCGDGTGNRIVGYWKRTRLAPRAKLIRDEKKKIVGVMTTFVFHYYTTNNGNDDNKNDNECSDIKTQWIMHEYTLNSQRFQPWVVCSVINKGIFNISFKYDYKYKVIDDPPIDPDVAEGNAAFATRAFLGLIERGLIERPKGTTQTHIEIEKDIFGGDLVNMAVTVPLGFRFVPTDLELVRDYLLKKKTNQPLPSDDVVIEYDVYSTEPWNLPVNNIGNCTRFYGRKIRKRSYYLVCREKNDDKSLCDGTRVKHMVKCGEGTSNRIVGYWERTRLAQQDKLICDERKKNVGIMKTFVFYYYTTNNGNNDNECSNIKTGWVMREYTLNSEQFQPLVLCSVINKSQFNISFEYDVKNNYIERIDYPPIEHVEWNAAFAGVLGIE